ncbi:uncharacterized protein TNIN_466251 [Trichonephila inaurata madagascariensis]|uniref:Uncharacterized protein n=1 Tax=Trichonephila inaurata madagascariensis TaxID=2747483 RepID=A0A8X6MGH6_9ARAC|nr:uncharacterized protein TNIN_466251 [Trichonephila inaurata madagascariensis]
MLNKTIRSNSRDLNLDLLAHMMSTFISTIPQPIIFKILIAGDEDSKVMPLSINYITSNEISLPELNTKILPYQAQLIPKFAKPYTIQQAQLDPEIGKISEVFYSDDDNIGLCPYIEFKIELQYKSIRCRPYRLSEPDRQFLNMQIQKWLKQAPAFIVEQSFYECTP